MQNHPSTAADHGRQWADGRTESLERRTPTAFTITGLLIGASLLVPVGASAFTDVAWAAGLVLVGLAVVAAAVGLVGLYPHVKEAAPGWATAGILSALIAGVAALGLLTMGAIAIIGGGVLGIALGTPMTLFVVVTLLMAGGVSLGFLSFGVAGWRTATLPRTAALLLVLGGSVLLVPVAGELLRRGVGIGPPPWLVLPALILVALDALAVGYSLRAGGHAGPAD